MAGLENRILNFDRGVEGILTNQRSTETRLPASTVLTPWDGTPTPKLEKMFAAPTRDQMLRDLLEPAWVDPAMLNPGSFRDMLGECAEKLHLAAQNDPDLEEADEVLGELKQCEELLAAYRNSLRQA